MISLPIRKSEWKGRMEVRPATFPSVLFSPGKSSYSVVKKIVKWKTRTTLQCQLHWTLVRTKEGFPEGAMVKNLPISAGDTRNRLYPWVGRISWRRKWQPTQSSCLENPMDGGAWWATAYGDAESDMTERLHFLFFLLGLTPCKPHFFFISWFLWAST